MRNAPTAMQFLATAGELRVDGISLAPRLPAANTGRKSWFAWCIVEDLVDRLRMGVG